MNMNSSTLVYIGSYPIDQNKSLRRQLVRVLKGVGLVNVLEILSKIQVPFYRARDIKLIDLSEFQKEELSKITSLPYITTNQYTSNGKNMHLTENYTSEVFYKQGDLLFLGEFLHSYIELAKKRLIKLKCNIGNRHKLKQKVHGQRTKSTGRKTKCIKGFQKKKKLQKEVEKR